MLLKRALYGCVESAALWYENLSHTMTGLGYVRNEYDICVFNRVNSKGIQCTATVHVDDLMITSVSTAMMRELTDGLKKRCGEISLAYGPLLNYLGMSLDFSHTGEARVTMSGYVDEVLSTSGVQGTAKTPATDGLFEIRADAAKVSEPIRAWFHRALAQLLYLAKCTRQECLTAVAYLATRMTKCNGDDIEKLHQLVRYLRGSNRAQTRGDRSICESVRRRIIRGARGWQVSHRQLRCDRRHRSRALQVHQAGCSVQVQH